MLSIILFLLITIACSDNGTETSLSTEGDQAESIENDALNDQLIIGISNNIDSLNPFNKGGLVSTYIQRFFYESLLNMEEPTKFEPRLGEFTTDDNQNFTLTLVKDATWTDGEPITTEDVAFTINTIADPDTLTSLATRISMIEGTDDTGKRVEGQEELVGLEIIDDYTMKIQTKEIVDINYLSEFLGFEVLIAPAHIFSQIEPSEIHNSEAAINPSITAGPYGFVEHKEENYLHLTANPDYYRGAPKINDVFFRILDGVTMVTELQSGSIDMTAGAGLGVVPDEDIPLIEELDHLSVESSIGNGIQYMIINHERDRFKDPLVRRALAHAIDKELAFENLLHGNGELVTTMYTSMNPYQNDALSPYPHDPDKALALLNEANFDFNEPVQMVVPIGNVAREQMADLTQQWLQDLGITVEQERYDFSTWMSRVREGNFDVGFVGQSATYEPNAENTFGTGGASNYGKISDPILDEYFEKGKKEITFEERKPIYDEMQEYYIETIPSIPLYTEAEYIIKDKNLIGGANPFFQSTTNNVHEWHFTN